MLLNFAWLIPGLPIISSAFVAILLLSFSKTMNRLTKPVSYFLIFSLIFSEIIDFILFQKDISGIAIPFGGLIFFGDSFQVVLDHQALFAGLVSGLIFLIIMLISFIRLKK